MISEREREYGYVIVDINDRSKRENRIADRDNDCGLYKVACWPCPSSSNKGSLSLTGHESIWKNAFSFVAQQSLSLMKSRKKKRRMLAKRRRRRKTKTTSKMPTKKKRNKKKNDGKEGTLHDFISFSRKEMTVVLQ